jgi:acyl-CoA synthetase (AMP-forming)/AMP-acid ligase II
MYQQKNEFLENYFLLTSGTESITYNDVENLGQQFKEILEPRRVAFIVCTNTVGSYSSLPILVRNGVVPLLLDGNIKPAYLNELINRYEPEYLLLPTELRKAFSSWNSVRNLFNYILLRNPDFSNGGVHHDLCLLLATSGSTGNPKLVRLSHLNLSSNATAIVSYLGISSNDRVISSLPMHYSYGLSVINSHFESGATIVLTEHSITEKNFWNSFINNCVTTFNGVPQTYETLLKMRFARMNLPSLKTMTQAGGKLSEFATIEVLKFCDLHNIKFFVMYGQTEASPRMSYVPPIVASAKIGSIGIPIPGGKLSLRSENNNVIHTNETVGELCYEGENVFMGYAETRKDLSKESETNGFLRTGDLAVRDSDGFYSIVGRLNRFVKLFGIRVNLDDLECHLNLIRSGCACTGTQDQINIFTTNQLALDELRTIAADFTGLNRHAFVAKFLESFPLTESGKVKYSELQ